MREALALLCLLLIVRTLLPYRSGGSVRNPLPDPPPPKPAPPPPPPDKR